MSLTKVHTWCFASGVDGYVANQNVEIQSVRDAVKVTSRQSVSTPGIKRNICVEPNTEYIISVKGYSKRKNAFLWVMDAHDGSRLIPCYVYLDCQMSWKSYRFNTCNTSSINFGTLFTEPHIGDFMVIAEYEIVRCDKTECC